MHKRCLRERKTTLEDLWRLWRLGTNRCHTTRASPNGVATIRKFSICLRFIKRHRMPPWFSTEETLLPWASSISSMEWWVGQSVGPMQAVWAKICFPRRFDCLAPKPDTTSSAVCIGPSQSCSDWSGHWRRRSGSAYVPSLWNSGSLLGTIQYQSPKSASQEDLIA